MSDKKEKGKSLRWMVTMLMLLMAAIGWGIAAGSYASDLQGWGPDSQHGEEIVVTNVVVEFASGAARFVWNAVIQIPNVHRVVLHTITRHPGILIVVGLLETGVWGFSWWMAKVEQQLDQEDKKLKRRYGGRS
jgi:hypothetical protein